jgi:hypothetical protein
MSVVRVHADDARPAREPNLDLVRRYLCADACARHRRGRGEQVEFALGIQAASREVEAAAQQGTPAEQLIERYRERLHARLGALGVSCDWEATRVSSVPDRARELQAIFATLAERDLVYRDGAVWRFRSGRFAAQSERDLEGLAGWSPAAIEAQRRALRRVDGFEVNATVLGGGELPVFVSAAEAVPRAEFVAISPRHPGVESVVGADALAALRRADAAAPAVQTERQAAVAGIEALLPVVLTTLLEESSGATASLGVPAEDEAARQIAGRLRKGGSLPFRAHERGGKPRPACRYGLADLPVSRRGSWGTPVPVLDCASCGTVPVTGGLPAQGGEAPACPRCGAARPDPGVLSAEFEAMWSWLPPGGLSEGGSVAAETVLFGDGDGNRLLHQRIAAAVAAGAEPGSDPVAGEAFAAAAVVAAVETGGPDCLANIDALDELAARAGADVVRFALFEAASPGTATGLYPHSVKRAERFLAGLRAFAEPRLAAAEPVASIDSGTRARRRLRAWCAIAADRVGASLDALDGKRATHNLALFRQRIEDFEERAAAAGELQDADREAVAFALARWAELAAPCVPALAAELTALTAAPAAEEVAA